MLQAFFFLSIYQMTVDFVCYCFFFFFPFGIVKFSLSSDELAGQYWSCGFCLQNHVSHTIIS